MIYIKFIQQSDTGIVIAEVYKADEDMKSRGRVGLQFFHWPHFNQEARLKRAHAWADKWIGNCEKYCIERPSIKVPA